MTTRTIGTTCWGEYFSLRANFSQAFSCIERQDEDGTWEPTGWQVADYPTPADAMREELEWTVRNSGSDLEESEADIEAAIADIQDV